MSSLTSWLKRYSRPLLLVLVFVLVGLLLWELRRVLLPFGLGLLLAWMLQPIIDGAERRLPGIGEHRKLKRVSTIIAIYLVTAAIIGLAGFYIVSVLGRSVISLMAAAPELIPEGVEVIEERLQSFLMTLPPSTRAQVSTLLMEAGSRGGQALASFITGGFVRIGSSSGMILGFVALPVFLFYLLKDWDKLRTDLYASLPHWLVLHVRSIAAIVHNVVGRYLRGQLVLGIVVGLAIWVLLMVVGIPYAAPLGVFGGIAELVPVIGPWLAGIVGVLVVLATAPEKVILVAIGYIVIQLLENNLLVPRVQGRQMHLHPALVIVLTIVAASRIGILGFLLVLPVTMTVVEVARYIKTQTRGYEQVGG